MYVLGLTMETQNNKTLGRETSYTFHDVFVCAFFVIVSWSHILWWEKTLSLLLYSLMAHRQTSVSLHASLSAVPLQYRCWR